MIMDSGSIYASSILPSFNGRKRSSSTDSASTVSPPCGACKFLRRKCTSGCVFAPHFQSDQGAARFAAVHKVFGASNISKLLSHLPLVRRHDAAATICFEAQARLADPVFGCVSTVLLLQRQVAALQAELAVVQTYLMNTQLALSIAYQQQQTANINATVNDLNNAILNPPPEEVSTAAVTTPTSSFDFAMSGFPPFSSGGAVRMPMTTTYDSAEMMDISNPAGFVDEMFD